MKLLTVYTTCKDTWWGKANLQPVFGHRQASWIELFFDLMFVAALSVLNHQAFAEGNQLYVAELSSYLLGFLSLWLIWMSVTFFSNWFETNSVRHRLIIFANILSIGLLTFGISTDLRAQIDWQGTIYLFSFLLSRVILFATWTSAQQPTLLQSVRQAITRIQVVYGCSLVIAIVAAVLLIGWQVPMYYGMLLWLGCVLLEFIGLPFIFAWSQHHVTTLHRSHLTERFGLFTMLLLGEMIIAELTGFRHQTLSLFSLLEMVLGLTIIFGYWWVYYDQVLSTAFRETGRSRIIWTTMHFVFALTTIMLGANFEFVTETLTITAMTRQWLVGGLLLFFISITILHYTLDHEHFYAQLAQTNDEEKLQSVHQFSRLVVRIRFVSIGLLAGLFILPITSTLLMLSLLALILLANVLAGLTVWLQATHHLSVAEEE